MSGRRAQRSRDRPGGVYVTAWKIGPTTLPLLCALTIQGLCPAANAGTFSQWQKWLASLQAQGYTVTQGTTVEFTTAYCQQTVFPAFQSCFNSDYEDPYLQALPPIGGGYVDPAYGNVTQQGANGQTLTQVYQLAPTEALLVVVDLPPTAAYFSYQSYMFTRPAADYPGASKSPSPDPDRTLVLGSFSNSVDNVGIMRQSGLGFGQGTIAVITTPNSSLANSLVSSYAAFGGNPATMFTDPMGSNLNPGLGPASDDYVSALRYSLPENTTAGNRWRDNPASNVQVYRIDQPASAPVTRFGTVTINSKAYNAAEATLSSSLAELSQLLQGWLSSQEDGRAVAIVKASTGEGVDANGTPIYGEFGPYCIANGIGCKADSQDTDAYKTVRVGKLSSDRTFIADGVNHAVTNNTSFLSLGIADSNTSTGVADISQTNASAVGFDSGVLNGSAAAVLKGLGLYGQASKGLIKDLPNLYVHIFTRSCSNLPSACSWPYLTVVDDSAIPAADQIQFIERAYVLPGYSNGANPTELLNPNMIY